MKSINGWDVITKQTDSRLVSKVIPGTKIRLRMRKDVLKLFLALAADYNREVAKLRAGECGAYVCRQAKLSKPGTWSDHASGTAVDLNWNHEGAVGPNGGMKKMTEEQIAACAAIKKRYKIVIWGGDKARGGDYAQSKNWDPMHFALKPGTTLEDVKRVTASLGIDDAGVRVGVSDSRPGVIAKLVARTSKPV